MSVDTDSIYAAADLLERPAEIGGTYQENKDFTVGVLIRAIADRHGHTPAAIVFAASKVAEAVLEDTNEQH